MPRQHAEQPAPTGAHYARSLIEASLDPLVTISPEGGRIGLTTAAQGGQ